MKMNLFYFNINLNGFIYKILCTARLYIKTGRTGVFPCSARFFTVFIDFQRFRFVYKSPFFGLFMRFTRL